jgi:hypothetical protein
MKILRFVWIDDKKSKVEQYRPVIEAGVEGQKTSLELIEVNSDLLGRLNEWCSANKSRPPDLIIIDHIFTMSLPFGLKGSSVAHLLRSELPRVPMVCVTAMFDRANSFDQEDISEYTALFRYQHLNDRLEELSAIARDFPKLHPTTANAREHFISALKPPGRDRVDLNQILPDEFQSEQHTTTEHRVARWIFDVFLRRPGFLYDRLYAATLLGLTVNGFSKVENKFDRAKYKGVFATNSEPKWWSSAVRKLLYELAGEGSPDIPQYAGRSLPGISPADYSVCYVSKKTEPPPDAIVSADSTSSAKLHVVRRMYSDRNPSDIGVTPGFETRLILKRTGK